MKYVVDLKTLVNQSGLEKVLYIVDEGDVVDADKSRAER